MRDALNSFGNISLATKDTDVKSADVLNFEAIGSGARFTQHHTGLMDDVYVVFKAAADFEAIDGFIPFIEQGDAESGGDITSPTKVVIGPEITAPKKGIVVMVPVPPQHKKYIRAGTTPKSTGVFTAKIVEAWIEFGPNLP